MKEDASTNKPLKALHGPAPQQRVRRQLSRHAKQSGDDERESGTEGRVGDGGHRVDEAAREEGVAVGLCVMGCFSPHVEVVQQPGDSRGEEAGQEGVRLSGSLGGVC